MPNTNIQPFPDMKTFTDLPASTQSALNGGTCVSDCMAGMQQSSAGVLRPAA
jgi:hypothetical protein